MARVVLNDDEFATVDKPYVMIDGGDEVKIQVKLSDADELNFVNLTLKTADNGAATLELMPEFRWNPSKTLWSGSLVAEEES